MEFELSKKDPVGAEQPRTVITLFSFNICDWQRLRLPVNNEQRANFSEAHLLTFSLQRDIAHVPSVGFFFL